MTESKYSLKELRARHGSSQLKNCTKNEIPTQTYNAWQQDFGMVKMQSAALPVALFEIETNGIFFDDLVE